MLSLYNSLTRKKEIFKPLVPGQVSIYACGITVYDDCHFGHGRSMIAFDVIVRYLKSLGNKVTYVRNITDIDDKIIKRAEERQVSLEDLTHHYIKSMHDDSKALGILAPDHEPRATNHIPTIIELITALIDRGFAYQAPNEDICFEVAKFEPYGKLSNKKLDDLLAGARIEIVKEKRSPLDFVLWKKAKPNEPSWPSPWGEGRPGWHIECSAMAMHELGESFDIHAGGMDLTFPHHENEIAQSEAATGKTFARYWLHAGLLQMNQEKMAKSTGNFVTIKELLKKYNPEVIRFFLISSHYRSPLNYTEENMDLAAKGLTRLYQSIKNFDLTEVIDGLHPIWLKRFNEAMDDDFNTPLALSVLFELSHEINKTKEILLAKTLKQLAQILGILQQEADEFFKLGIDVNDAKHIEALIAERAKARAAKDWIRADEIRNLLLQEGVELEDTPAGTIWRR